MSIGARLGISYTLSAFAMLAMVTAVLYWILIRGLEWDEHQLVFNKVKMFEATLRVNGDNMDILNNEVNLEGGAYWPGQHYFVYSRIIDEFGKVLIEAPGMEQLLPETVFPPPVVRRALPSTFVNRSAPPPVRPEKVPWRFSSVNPPPAERKSTSARRGNQIS